MDLEEYGKKMLAGKDTAALKKLTESEEGARLAARFDGTAIERAAREGDTGALTALLKSVLGTPEGRRFAEQVKKAVDDRGR